MFPLFTISNRCPLTLSALPDFIATTSISDFQVPLPIFSLFRLVYRCADAPAIGSPWLLHQLNMKLDTDLNPGTFVNTRHYALTTVACQSHDTVGLFRCGHFGTSSFRVSITCYLCASLLFVPTHQIPRYRCICKARYRARG